MNQIKPKIKLTRNTLTLLLLVVAVLLACFVQVATIRAWFYSSLDTSGQGHNPQPVANGAIGFDAELFTEGIEYLGGASDEEIGASGVQGASFMMSLSGAEDGELLGDEYLGDDENIELNELDYDSEIQNENSFLIKDTFTYQNYESNFHEVFVRFKLNEYGVSDVLDVQAFFYLDSAGGRVTMPRLDFTDVEPYYYYPYSIKPGDSFSMEYVLRMPDWVDSDWVSRENYLDYEIIQAVNNACIFQWNVMFENGEVLPYDTTNYIKTTFADYIPEPRQASMKQSLTVPFESISADVPLGAGSPGEGASPENPGEIIIDGGNSGVEGEDGVEGEEDGTSDADSPSGTGTDTPSDSSTDSGDGSSDSSFGGDSGGSSDSSSGGGDNDGSSDSSSGGGDSGGSSDSSSGGGDSGGSSGGGGDSGGSSGGGGDSGGSSGGGGDSGGSSGGE